MCQARPVTLRFLPPPGQAARVSAFRLHPACSVSPSHLVPVLPPAPPRSLPLPCPSVLVLCPAPSPLLACLLLSGRSMSASLPLSVTFSTPAAPTPLTDGRGGRVRTHVSHAGCSLRDFSGSPCSSSLRRARNPSGRPAGRGSWAQALVISPKQPTRRAHMRPGLNYLGLLTLTLPPSQGSCAPGLGSS